jgi:hypothetical protein
MLKHAKVIFFYIDTYQPNSIPTKLTTWPNKINLTEHVNFTNLNT